MKSTVIIPTCCRHADLERLLYSLSKQINHPNEVIIVACSSDTKSLLICNKFKVQYPIIKLVETRKKSVINALNIGLKLAQGDIICLIDDDVWLPPDWFQKIRVAFEANKNLGAYGGRDHLQLSDEPNLAHPLPVPTIGRFRWDGTLKGNHHCGAINSPLKVDVLKGVNLSFRSQALIDLQIDTSLEDKGAEVCWEIDICQRIKKSGYDLIYDNNNYVLHYASPRQSYDNRSNVFSPVIPKRTFNEALVVAKYRSCIELLLFLLRRIIVGNTLSPGIFCGVMLTHKYGFQVVKLTCKNLKFLLMGAQEGIRKHKATIKQNKNT